MVYRGSDEAIRWLLAELLSEMEPRSIRDDKVDLPVMTLEQLVDDDGELRRVGTEMLGGVLKDIGLLRLLVRIAIISPPSDYDQAIYQAAMNLEDTDSLAWIYACGIGTESDDVKAIRLFRSNQELSPLYSGVWNDWDLMEKHSFIRNRIDMPDGKVRIEDLISAYINSDVALDRLVYRMGIMSCLTSHGDLDTAFRAVSLVERLHVEDTDLLMNIVESIHPVIYGLREATYLDDEEVIRFGILEDFERGHSADWAVSTLSSSGYLSKPTPFTAIGLLNSDLTDAQMYRIMSALYFCPEKVVIQWLDGGSDPLEPTLTNERRSLDPEPMDDRPEDRSDEEYVGYVHDSSDPELNCQYIPDRAVAEEGRFSDECPGVDSTDDVADGEARNSSIRAEELREAYSGDPVAQFNAGVTSLEDSRFDDAKAWFVISSIQNVSDAQFNLALMYLEGTGIDADPRRGVGWMIDSALGGDGGSCSYLGYLYREDDSVENVEGLSKSDRSSAIWNWIAASYGDPKASFNLAAMYEFGLGLDLSMDKAVAWYRKAISGDVPEAMYNLGNIYYLGKGVTQSDEWARTFYARASRLGDADAMCNLASMIWMSRTGPKDEEKAISLFEKAGEMGSGLAFHNLGSIYDSESETHHSKERAVQFYSKAIELGEINSMINLGIMNEQGDGVEVDLHKAAELYKRVSEEGGPECNDCRRHLAFMYMEGEGVEQSPEDCIRLYEEAAALGDEKAMYNLGAIYDNGDIVEDSIETAIEWYEKAMDHGSPDAASVLGDIYLEGDGVEESEDIANRFYDKARELEIAETLFKLGNRSRSERDMDSAEQYYRMSASKGSKKAIRALEELGNRWDPDDAPSDIDMPPDAIDDADQAVDIVQRPVIASSMMVVRPILRLHGRIST